MVYNSSNSLIWSSQEQQHVVNIIFCKISLASEQQHDNYLCSHINQYISNSQDYVRASPTVPYFFLLKLIVSQLLKRYWEGKKKTIYKSF